MNQRSTEVLRMFEIDRDVTTHFYIKPHGRRLASDCVVCWGSSRDWKAILMAAFERTYQGSRQDKALVALFEAGTTGNGPARTLVREAASRLGIVRVEWLE
jgi:hypothetical protein